MAPPGGLPLGAVRAIPGPASPAPSAPPVLSLNPGLSAGVVLVVTPSGAGTGVLLDKEGYILTNWHLVADYPYLSVLFAHPGTDHVDTTLSRAGRMVQSNRLTDLALVKVDSLPSDARPIRAAPSAVVSPGQVVYSLSYSTAGNLDATAGTVSKVAADQLWYAGHNVIHRASVIQVQGGSQPISTGGPLLNGAFELVGIITYGGRGRPVHHALALETVAAFLRAGDPRRAALLP